MTLWRHDLVKTIPGPIFILLFALETYLEESEMVQSTITALCTCQITNIIMVGNMVILLVPEIVLGLKVKFFFSSCSSTKDQNYTIFESQIECSPNHSTIKVSPSNQIHTIKSSYTSIISFSESNCLFSLKL